jgi:hypothetical protein
VAWADGSSRTELEAADGDGALLLRLDPLPSLEVDGHRLQPPDLHPLEALGFVHQIERLIRTTEGAAPWPDAAVGMSIEALLGDDA